MFGFSWGGFQKRMKQRVEADFAPADQAEALARLQAWTNADRGAGARWEAVLGYAHGDLLRLRDALHAVRTSPRDISTAAAERTLQRRVEEFPAADRAEAESLLRGLRTTRDGPGVWEEVAIVAGGSLPELRAALEMARTDWRDLKVAAAVRMVRLRLLGRPTPRQQVLGPTEVAQIERDFARHRPIAERHFPPEQVADVMLRMGGWTASAEDVFRLARGDAGRLGALVAGRAAGEADPDVPAPLADLPLAAAELIRRDFAPDAWADAAGTAAQVRPAPGMGGVLDWLLLAEYAGGDAAALREAVRLHRNDYDALIRGIAARRRARHTSG